MVTTKNMASNKLCLSEITIWDTQVKCIAICVVKKRYKFFQAIFIRNFNKPNIMSQSVDVSLEWNISWNETGDISSQIFENSWEQFSRLPFRSR